MPPGVLSRYKFCQGVTRTDGKILLTERAPFRYRVLPDNRRHEVVAGDSLWSLAARYFAQFGTVRNPASNLWWVIADFQPIPIIDPLCRLEPGTVVLIPSERVVRSVVFDESRRRL